MESLVQLMLCSPVGTISTNNNNALNSKFIQLFNPF